jgi:signal transduction histidine kinase
MAHTGILFAVYGDDDQRLVGELRVGRPYATGCASVHADMLRVCGVRTERGLLAVVGAAKITLLPTLAGAALLAVLLAAALAWVVSRPVSRVAVAPLSRLRERIDGLSLDALSQAQLGAAEHVLEVDALRHTIGQLIVRVERALAQAQRFAANAAHELRTPLTALRAELELLSENIGEPALRSHAARAQRKLSELSVLVERLLILAVPARSSGDAREVVSLRDLLEDTCEALPTKERQRVELSEDDALVSGDAVLLAIMVSNAVANGLKFGHHVAVSLACADSCAVIQIDDDGPGVSEADRERVFEPFVRSLEALRLPGNGLGLALIRHVAQTHGGSATFANKAEGGARLQIRLPVAASL